MSSIKIDEATLNDLRYAVRSLMEIGKRGELMEADCLALYETTCLMVRMTRSLAPLTNPERDRTTAESAKKQESKKSQQNSDNDKTRGSKSQRRA